MAKKESPKPLWDRQFDILFKNKTRNACLGLVKSELGLGSPRQRELNASSLQEGRHPHPLQFPKDQVLDSEVENLKKQQNATNLETLKLVAEQDLATFIYEVITLFPPDIIPAYKKCLHAYKEEVHSAFISQDRKRIIEMLNILDSHYMCLEEEPCYCEKIREMIRAKKIQFKKDNPNPNPEDPDSEDDDTRITFMVNPR